MKLISVLPLAGMAIAQMTVMSVAPAPAASGMTHTVTVGGVKPAETGGVVPILSYQPESIIAAQGDKVKFIFMQKNHTVTQSTFDEPCAKMAGGMDSGFMPNAEGKEGVEWEMEVTTTEPLWFYCKQRTGVHCGKGMVFAINAATTGDKTMSDFKQLAILKNGTEALTVAAIASAPATAAAAASTVTVVAGGGEAPIVTGTGAATATAALASATVAVGQGKTGNGDACTCHCLCGVNQFPANAGINAFGGFGGMIPAGSP